MESEQVCNLTLSWPAKPAWPVGPPLSRSVEPYSLVNWTWTSHQQTGQVLKMVQNAPKSRPVDQLYSHVVANPWSKPKTKMKNGCLTDSKGPVESERVRNLTLSWPAQPAKPARPAGLAAPRC